MRDDARPRLLLVLPRTTYRAQAFMDAAHQLDIALTVASDHRSVFADAEPEKLLALDFHDLERSVETVRAFASTRPIAAIFGVDDDTAVVATAVGEALGIARNPLDAVMAARDKHRQRERMHAAGVRVPRFTLHRAGDDVEQVMADVSYPCVVKPVALSASRGVIRADSRDEFRRAHARLLEILDAPDVRDRGHQGFLVESFVPGPECALEGLVVDGRLQVLALFDKPDPLDGPFFEETIYVTPSRLDPEVQDALVSCAQDAIDALGLRHGPVHIELRHNDEGVWLIELAARPIGGKCGEVLRFGLDGDWSLERLLLAHAVGQMGPVPAREPQAAGVLMIPTPTAGRLGEVGGVDRARAVPLVTGIAISAHRGQELVPLPEGSQYLGFVFARGEAPALVEQALRRAHGELHVEIEKHVRS